MKKINWKEKFSLSKIISIAIITVLIGAAAIIYLPDYITYSRALNAASNGEFSEARDMFRKLGDYIDSEEWIIECDYSLANQQLENGNYVQAAQMFESMGDYKDSADMVRECNYREALRLLENGESDSALAIFQTLGKYKDSQSLLIELLNNNTVAEELEIPQLASVVEAVYSIHGQVDTKTYIDTFRNSIPQNIIATGYAHTVALCSDGTVIAAGDNSYGQCNTADWTDIVSVAAGGNFTIGLKKDGTIVACGDNSYGQLDIASMNGAVSIFAGNTDTAAVLSTGQIVLFGYNDFDVSGSMNISNISIGAYTLTGISDDGKLYSTSALSSDIDAENPLYCVYVGSASSLALYQDGTVSASFDADCEWEEVVCAAIGTRYAAALCTDGSLELHSFRESDCEDVDFSEYSDYIAVSARSSHIVALRSDGTLVAFGDNSHGQCDVTEWDIF